MKRLLVTGDIHGSYTTWLVLRELLLPEDGFVIAGDFFGTRYGNYHNEDFQPEAIRKELKALEQPVFYVYGNCDSPDFFPGCHDTLSFTALGKSIFLHHGHKSMKLMQNVDIIIQGHTHIYELKKTKTRILMNPGSITSPRNGIPSYGIIEKHLVSIISLQTGKPLLCLPI